jgi:hypothetical protein
MSPESLLNENAVISLEWLVKFAINHYPFITLFCGSSGIYEAVTRIILCYLLNMLETALFVSISGLMKLDPLPYKCLPVYRSHFVYSLQ